MELKVIAARGFETRRGIHWSGVLTADGEKVLRFENAGDGGCTHFDWKPGCNRKAIERELCAIAYDVSFEQLDAAVGELWDAAMLAEA
jgi:hypothetical protein